MVDSGWWIIDRALPCLPLALGRFYTRHLPFIIKYRSILWISFFLLKPFPPVEMGADFRPGSPYVRVPELPLRPGFQPNARSAQTGEADKLMGRFADHDHQNGITLIPKVIGFTVYPLSFSALNSSFNP